MDFKLIYLTTGANGAGKTLVTLEDVRNQQLKENRPVYYFGFDLYEEKAKEFGWKKFDPKEWQLLPDGSICIMDECQDYFGAHCFSKDLPSYVTEIAISRRKRGFDFWMITPHPSLLHIFIRRLISSPSWHRHIKRTFGADMVSVLVFGSPDMKCEDNGAGARAEVTMRAYPKHVYEWYKSASINTGKKKIPRSVYFLGFAVLAIPALIVGVYYALKPDPEKISSTVATEKNQMPSSGQTPGQNQNTVMSPAEYASAYTARFPGLPHTAPIYDAVTAPVVAPYPAACISMGTRCECFSQQGTKIITSEEICQQITKNGFFISWTQNTTTPGSEQTEEKQPETQPADIDLIKMVRKVPDQF